MTRVCHFSPVRFEYYYEYWCLPNRCKDLWIDEITRRGIARLLLQHNIIRIMIFTNHGEKNKNQMTFYIIINPDLTVVVSTQTKFLPLDIGVCVPYRQTRYYIKQRPPIIVIIIVIGDIYIL